jgi:hypothetical protein
MINEFAGTTGWGCPCSLQAHGCTDPDCSLTGEEVRAAPLILCAGTRWLIISAVLCCGGGGVRVPLRAPSHRAMLYRARCDVAVSGAAAAVTRSVLCPQVLDILSFSHTLGKFWDVGVLWLMVATFRLAFLLVLKTRQASAR